MEEKEKKINYLIYALVFVVVLVIATIAVTYAHYKVNTTKDSPLGGGTATLECIDMTLSDNSTTLGLSHNYPITDELAMQSGSVTPLKVTITNNCSNAVKYTLALSTLALTSNQTNYIEDSKIRYKILKNNANHKGIDYLSSIPKISTSSKLYTDLTGTDGELLTKYPNYTLKQIYSVDDLVTLAANTSNTYDLYMWVDYYEGDSRMYYGNNLSHDESYDGTTEGKKFAAALSLTFTTEENEIYSLGQYLIDNSISGLDKNFIGTDTLYRFSGTTGNTGINNYICLGTTSKCASGSDNMYRIIGVEPSTGYVKVIKQTKYRENIYWNSSIGVTWPNSGAYSTMITWYNSISFKNMIVSHLWNIGDIIDAANITTRLAVLNLENQSPTQAYVGITSLTDYYMAYREDQNWSSTYSNYANNWIHLANNGNTSDTEMTMTRKNDEYSLGIKENGRISSAMYIGINSGSVRPVFYLNSTVSRISGTGTSGDPFIVG